MTLPDSKEKGVALVNITEEEVLEQQKLNSTEWKGALPLDAYLRREKMLVEQRLTREGGLTPWGLVYENELGRTVLSSCETIRKKAVVAKDGQVKDVISHGVCSVFCPPEHRGKGYAGTMIRALGEKLQTWQTDRDECLFSVLWSDIGKQFYAARGWHPFPSAHIILKPLTGSSSRTDLPSTRPLKSAELSDLCAIDERLVRKHVAQAASKRKTAVAIIPDTETYEWHHAREAFVGNELYGKTAEIKGAMVGAEPGKRVWCVWTRTWANSNPNESKGNTLHILRLVVEDGEYADYEAATEEGATAVKGSVTALATAALLAAAQEEASKWSMGEIDIWNPTSSTLAAGRTLDSSVQIVHREKDSISSLRWYGEGSEDPISQIEWVGNEKYAWC